MIEKKQIHEIDYFKPKHQKYIFVTRNLADLLWASYNFWCVQKFDIGCENKDSSQWLSKLKNSYKSPGLFHELVSAISIGSVEASMLKGGLYLTNKLSYQTSIARFLEIVVKTNIIVIKGEELSSFKTWRKISAFTGLKLSHHRWKQFSSIRINTNRNPGSYSVSNVTKNNLLGSYNVSGHRMMLNETRAAINNIFKGTCLWLKEHFDVHYHNVC
jgi:hypothetical protein